MTRTGIFLCTCDQRINKGVQVDRVVDALSGEARVELAPHVCLPDGIRNLKREIVENNLERVVIAACPARFQEKHLQDACGEAGVNVNHFALVDWREGCAWAHRGDKDSATAKAIDLARMGLAHVAHARPLDGVLTKIVPRVLVVGGGIAGMTAARSLADRGIDVILVEREMQLGGQLRGAPLNGQADAFDTTRLDVLHHPRIEVRLNSRLIATDGPVGNYRVEVASPSCSNVFELKVGAVVVATGAREYRDARLYRYDGRRVVTLGEFEPPNSNLQIPTSNHQPPTSIVYLLCAGSRDDQISYCSNVCCLGALNQAIRVKRANPTANVTVLFRDLYLLGNELNEEVVRDARRLGVEFIRYSAFKPPRVDDDFVVVCDTAGNTRWVGYDGVVLATPLVPREDAGAIARLFNLPRDEDGFFPDPHRRLRPEDQSERGIFVCGSAHRPVDMDTAILQGLTAAARAARFIQRREVMRPSSSAFVNAPSCTGCAQCVETCAFGAIEMRPSSPVPGLSRERRTGDGVLDRAIIDPFLCQACGNCMVACPSKAIDMPTSSDAQILAQIDAALERQGDTETRRNGDALPVSASPHPRVLIFGCQWSGFAAMELAGARRLKYSANARVIELPCSARLDPMHILYALLNGAEVVMLALCPPKECHFGKGNRYAEARIENLSAQLAAHGIDPRRLTTARMMGDDAGAWVKAVEEVMTGAGTLPDVPGHDRDVSHLGSRR